MKNAILTQAGAERICHLELAGQIVQYDKVHELGLCVENVYSRGARLCGCLSISGEDAALILQETTAEIK